MNKNESRLRRAKSTRAHIRKLAVARLSVHRTGQHLYAQVFDASGEKVVAAASTVQKSVAEGLKGTDFCTVDAAATVQKSVAEGLKGTKNLTAAAAVGKAVAERALAAGIESVAFDRSGFRYHGRIKALADAAREAGLKF